MPSTFAYQGLFFSAFGAGVMRAPCWRLLLVGQAKAGRYVIVAMLPLGGL